MDFNTLIKIAFSLEVPIVILIQFSQPKDDSFLTITPLSKSLSTIFSATVLFSQTVVIKFV